ncbi:hypothetical protein HRR83_004189 [Exophiala dermatitidis]|nr:hypothetical protein HRR77_006065 [Exophiala dermatitidis]KAJ4574361.1 hypothetical protein HRR81_004264 [Exophiala dermatitidis]KAJ4598043.1 hypothetical protein HRR83_004189 [Exophiala dermatitidis]KAJ4611942.1 hypothetical protein HRR85_004767 [Exophiala dermatitidis]KAJ4672937.1 hypothetical protein HRR93_005020 [Exophiala dermatitidis]
MAPKKRTPGNVIDLLSDDDSEIHIIPPSQYPGANRNRPDPGQKPPDLPAKLKEQHRLYLQDSHAPSSGRLHGGYNLETLEYEEHLIPEGQLNCRGCRLSPIEFDENGQEIPAAVTHEKRQKILMDKFEKKWAEEDAERSSKNATTDYRNENPGRQPSVIALDVEHAPVTNNNQANRPRGSLSVPGNANHGSKRRARGGSGSGCGSVSGPIDKQVPEPNPASPQTDGRVRESESDIESSTEAGSGSDTELHIPAPTPVSLSELREGRMAPSSSSSATSASFAPRSLRRSNINSKNRNVLDNGKGKDREEIPETEVLELDSDDEEELDNLNFESNEHKHNNGHSGDNHDEEDEDEELRRAIALSLQDQQHMEDNNTTTTSKTAGAYASASASASSDHHHHHPHDHNPQAKRRKLAHAALLQQRLDGREQIQTQRQQPKPIRDTIVVTSPTTATTKGSAAAPTSSGSISTSVGGGGGGGSGAGAGAGGLAGFDRKQMEAERLARLKRKCQSEDGGDTQKSEQEQKQRPHGGSGATISTSSTTGTNHKAPQQNKKSEMTTGLGSHTHSQRAISISPPPVRRPTTRPDDRDRVPQPAPAGDHRFSTARHPALTAGGSHGSSIARPGTTSSENKHKNQNTTTSRGDGRTDAPPTGSNNKNSIKLNYYPKGIVFKTQIPGSNDNSTNRTIDFATLISPASALESCLLSSFIWNFDWLFSHFDTKRTKFQLVMHAKQPSRREELKADFAGIPNARLCFPPMDGIVNCMHSKLMLLFYNDENNSNSQIGHRLGHGHRNGSNASTRCRIVVPTANLVDFDWGVGGIMENTVWLIDLPPATASATAVKTQAQAQAELTGRRATDDSSVTTAFQKSLTAFLRAQTVPEDVIRKLERFDFTETAHLGFVHTIGGMHSGGGGGKEQTWRTTGLPLLGQTITELGLTPPAARGRGQGQGHGPGPIQLDYVTSSLGSLTDEFVSSIYLAAQGDDGLTEYNRRNSTTAAGRKGTSTGGGQMTLFGVKGRKPSVANSGMFSGGHDDWKENMRVYYPSDETVRRSRGGPRNAGTICFNMKWWHNGRFPQSIMRDCVSVREGLLMHNKIMFVRFAVPVELGKPQELAKVGWAYVGSANLSESAWGRLVQDKATKQPKLNCRNWECGVIIPLVAEGKVDPDNGKSNSGHTAGLEMFDHLVPVPMRYPGERFEGKKPWTTGMYDY